MGRWMEITPKAGATPELLQNLSYAGMKAFERNGLVYALIGKKDVSWLQTGGHEAPGAGGVEQKIGRHIERFAWIDKPPSEQWTNVADRWATGIKGLHKEVGWRLLITLYERALHVTPRPTDTIVLEVSPVVLQVESRIGTVGQVYTALDTLVHHNMVHIVRRAAAFERDGVWQVAIDPALLEVYEQKKAEGTVPILVPGKIVPRTAPAEAKPTTPALAPVAEMVAFEGTAVVRVNVAFTVPAHKGPTLTTLLTTLIAKVARDRAMTPEGGVTCSIELGEQSTAKGE